MTRTAPAFVAATWLGCLLGCESGARPAEASQAVAQAQPAALAPAPPASELQAIAPVAVVPREGPRLPGGMRFPGRGLEHDFLVEQLGRAKPLSFKAVSTNGGVMRVRMAAPFDAAFKPTTPERPLGPMSEVAAYRLARCLHMDNVPPAVTRDIPAAQIRAALDPESKQSWSELRKHMGIADDAVVRGVAIYWIPELADIGLERRDGLLRADEWLPVTGVVPADRRSLAASLSTMLAFDYLIGNFDRWSGGNVRGDVRATLIYVRDHDLAFPAKMNESLHRRLWQDVVRAERFSRTFYASLKRLTRECFERELLQDPLGAALGKRQVAGVFDRHEALLSHVESLIAVHGEAQVLAFE